MKKQLKNLWIFPFIGGLMGFILSPVNGRSNNPINHSTITTIDLTRYMGKWYEIARYEHRFEKGMTHVTADYSILPNGKIRVVNQGIKDGIHKEIIGKAKQPDPEKYPGRLKVSFFLWFYSDYYILELDNNYQYAVVGSSSDKYLWILSRTPKLPQTTLDVIFQTLKQRGYNLSRLVLVKQ